MKADARSAQAMLLGKVLSEGPDLSQSRHVIFCPKPELRSKSQCPGGKIAYVVCYG